MRAENAAEGVRRVRMGGEIHPLREVFIRAMVTGAASGPLVAVVLRLWSYPIEDATMSGTASALVAFLAIWLWPRRHDVVIETQPVTTSRSAGHVVLLAPKTDAQPPTEGERLAEFVQACELDTSTRRLEGLGYSRAEIERFRDYLIKSGWAGWKGADRRLGWQLAAPVDEILDNLG
jgi:hypothetical protein